MARYLVTGCAGFIASKVVEHLLEDGHTILGVDNLNDAYDVRLKQWRLDRLMNQKAFEFVRIDIVDQTALESLWTQQAKNGERPFSAVINLAARAGVRQSLVDPWSYYETNVTGTLNLLELCRRFGVAKFVLASSSSLYGQHNEMPYHEDQDTDMPLSPYAASKKAAEALCYTYHHLYGIDVTVLRYFTVYGPAGRPDMSLYRFIQWIAEGLPVIVYGDGSQSRDFTYVDDIARGTIATLKPLGFQVINLGSHRPVVLIEAIRLIEKLVGKKAHIKHLPRQPADVPATWADITRATEILGWEPTTHLEEGLHNAVNWYMHQRTWAKEVTLA